MQQLTLSQYADQIGAQLKPCDLQNMPIIERSKSGGMFGGVGTVIEWLNVKTPDPKGGLNRQGYWPFSVQKDDSGKLHVIASSY